MSLIKRHQTKVKVLQQAIQVTYSATTKPIVGGYRWLVTSVVWIPAIIAILLGLFGVVLVAVAVIIILLWLLFTGFFQVFGAIAIAGQSWQTAFFKRLRLDLDWSAIYRMANWLRGCSNGVPCADELC